uniref:C-type lectin domain-containing protein n=1 Tax=Cyprinodon variegatus TaxID=28743 RepID=A0A3Q2CXE4_CYPVA
MKEQTLKTHEGTVLIDQSCFNNCQLYEYHYINEEKNWTEAQQYCREKHTDLATVSNMTDMKRLLSNSAGNMTEAWIGLYDQTDVNRTWYWSLPGNELNNQQSNSGLCVMTVLDDEGRWMSEKCTVKKPYICYEDKVILIKENKTWENALNYCRDHYHDLVTITSLDEQRWIQEKAKKASTDYVWIGLHYACTLDLWFWVSDEVVSYNNWVSNGPVDDCDMSGAIEAREKYWWTKRNYLAEFNFICSKN